MSFDIICYSIYQSIIEKEKTFQTKMSFDIICYQFFWVCSFVLAKFQTKMSFDIICYLTKLCKKICGWVSNQDELWYNLLLFTECWEDKEFVVSNQDELWYNLLFFEASSILFNQVSRFQTKMSFDIICYRLLHNQALVKLCFKPRWALI